MTNDRRKFLKGCAAAGIGVGAIGYSKILFHSIPFTSQGDRNTFRYYGNAQAPEWLFDKKTGKHKVNPDYVIKHSVCVQCHGECGLRATVHKESGKLCRLTGNPYHPNTRIDFIDSKVPISETATTTGTLCARGTAGMQTAYDPYRITMPLKRAGARGDNKWVPIEWEDFIKEVVEGGQLFKDTNDSLSKDVHVKGLRALYDAKDQWIDDNNHDYGRMTNKLIIQGGRIVKSRKDFQTRFSHAFGTVNNYEHTNICELSHHVATAEVYNGKHNLKSDMMQSEFMIFWGTAPGEANFPMQTMAKYSALARAKGSKIIVIDPVLPRTITQDPNMTWITPNPGTDGAIAMAMIQWIIDNKRYNEKHLSFTNKKSAKAGGELCFTNSTFLIIADPNHERYGQMLKPSDAGLGNDKGNVVMANGSPALPENVDMATVDYSGDVNGIMVKTSFTMMKESAHKHTLEQYAEISGLSKQQIIDLADQFTSYGRKAVSELYRGIAQHPNGYYTSFAIYQLNLLVGNLNWTGGASLGGGKYSYNKVRYDLQKIPNLKRHDVGMRIGRDLHNYEHSQEYKNKKAKGENPYPATRPWFPMAKDVFSEVIPSMLQGYPYTADVLLWHKCTPLYSTPTSGRDSIIERLKDPKNIPLIISSDIVIGDSTKYADYVLPDITYLERYVHHPTVDATMIKGTAVRYPVIEPLTGKTKDGLNYSLEAFYIDVAKRLNLPGFGDKSIVDNEGKLWDLNTIEDYYLKVTANLAFSSGGGNVMDATAEDIEVSGLKEYMEKHKNRLRPDEWSKVAYLVSRGGRFDDASTRYNGDQLGHQYNGMVQMYTEKIAKLKDSMTGQPFIGTATWMPTTTIMGKPLSTLDRDNHFTLLTKKTALESHSRLASNTYIREITPTNAVEMNMGDGLKLGLKTGDMVEVSTATGTMRGNVKLLQGIKPGVITFTVGFGHVSYGAEDYKIGGKTIKGNKQRGAGINMNPIMRLDPDVPDMPLMDPVGGSCSFYDTKAKVRKI